MKGCRKMKNIHPIMLDKYLNGSQFQKIDEHIYKQLSDGSIRIALSCQLEGDEDSQYLLEDILDKYCVNCADYIEEKQSGDTRMYSFELEGSLGNGKDYQNILEVSKLIGKRVYNKEIDGRAKLFIE